MCAEKLWDNVWMKGYTFFDISDTRFYEGIDFFSLPEPNE